MKVGKNDQDVKADRYHIDQQGQEGFET